MRVPYVAPKPEAKWTKKDIDVLKSQLTTFWLRERTPQGTFWSKKTDDDDRAR
jgi:hypothetical protein